MPTFCVTTVSWVFLEQIFCWSSVPITSDGKLHFSCSNFLKHYTFLSLLILKSQGEESLLSFALMVPFLFFQCISILCYEWMKINAHTSRGIDTAAGTMSPFRLLLISIHVLNSILGHVIDRFLVYCRQEVDDWSVVERYLVGICICGNTSLCWQNQNSCSEVDWLFSAYILGRNVKGRKTK